MNAASSCWFHLSVNAFSYTATGLGTSQRLNHLYRDMEIVRGTCFFLVSFFAFAPMSVSQFSLQPFKVAGKDVFRGSLAHMQTNNDCRSHMMTSLLFQGTSLDQVLLAQLRRSLAAYHIILGGPNQSQMWYGPIYSRALVTRMSHNSLPFLGSTDPPLFNLVSEPHKVILYAQGNSRTQQLS